MVIQHNIMALSAYRYMGINNKNLAKSLERLSSGYRINRAADDPAGLGISERMRAQITGLKRAIMNANDGISMVQAAEGALAEVHSILNRMVDLATQAANGTVQGSDRAKMEQEMQALKEEIDRISNATNFNGIPLLDGSLAAHAPPEVKGLALTETEASAGRYGFQATPKVDGLKYGDKLTYSLGLDTGETVNVAFVVSKDLKNLVSSDGTHYALSAMPSGGANSALGEELTGALVSELSKTQLKKGFLIDQSTATINNNGDITTTTSLFITNREAGAAAAKVTGLSYKVNSNTPENIGISVFTSAPPADACHVISSDALNIFSATNGGTNEAEATFSVNGQKFLLVDADHFDELLPQIKDRSVNIVKVSGLAQLGFSGWELQNIATAINNKTGMGFEVDSIQQGIRVKTSGKPAGLTLQVGDTAASYNKITVTINGMSCAALGIENISVGSQEAAQSALAKIKKAVSGVSAQRGNLGALQNRLQHTVNSLSVQAENLQAAESRIRDVDMAKEMMNFTRANVLAQVAQAMLAHAFQQPQQILTLLRSI